MRFNYFILSIALTVAAGSGAFAQKKPADKKPADKTAKPADKTTKPAEKTTPATTDKKQDAASNAVAEEIEVVRPYKPVLADVSKIRRSPEMDLNKTFKPQLNYSISDKRLEQNSDIRQLQSQPLAEIIQPELTNNYVKIGLGNLATGFGEVYVNTGKDEALQGGVFFKHFNQKGDIDGQKVSRQQFGIFGRSIQDKFAVNGDLTYHRFATNFYGFIPEQPAPTTDIEKQTYNLIELNGDIGNNFNQDDQAVEYKVKANAYYLNNKTDQKETSFKLDGYVNKAINQFNVGANLVGDFTNINQPLFNTSNNIFRLKPYVKFQGTNYMLKIGLNFASEFGDSTSTNFLPDVTAEFALAPEYATIFAGYTGDVIKTSLRNTATENPYINQNIAIVNALEKSNIFGGIKGNAGAGFGYKAMVSYRTIENMPLFINDSQSPNKFDLTYDSKAKVFSLEGEISLKASEAILWTGRFITSNYDVSQQREAWFKPTLQLVSNVRANINKAFSVDGEVVINGGSKAFVPANPDQILTLDSYVDLSGGAEYRLKNNIGIYLRVNNILNSQYERYLYYPKVGINFLGGLNYSF
ncbi:hypothetical protein GS399_10325 [Pedobacter sp. HMF7647]|uniref:TonB-dependent receptor n=1 Tax=Hufsiella arboris TaxID=2695275 RepID=A0A7K1Y9V5_9SPHI|nr:hypothetical protein [Hufsiella arboris]MXV51365.1 hypothetical protein [Hufsiella arboris]